MPLKQTTFEDKDQLNQAFADRICRILSAAIESKGRASLLVSGGRTPVALFNELSNRPLAWQAIDISLADDRWVAPDHDASNARLVREELLINRAAEATFYDLNTSHEDAEDAVDEVTERLNAVRRPFDVLILGMGEDGHTASLFPCSEQLQAGLNMNSGQQYIAVQPTTAPHQRISLTLPALLNSEHIFLHLTGDAKKQVIEQALNGDDEQDMPIRAVLNRADVELFWAP